MAGCSDWLASFPFTPNLVETYMPMACGDDENNNVCTCVFRLEWERESAVQLPHPKGIDGVGKGKKLG